MLQMESILRHGQGVTEMEQDAQGQTGRDQYAADLYRKSAVVVGDVDGEVARQRVGPSNNLIDGFIGILGGLEQWLVVCGAVEQLGGRSSRSVTLDGGSCSPGFAHDVDESLGPAGGDGVNSVLVDCDPGRESGVIHPGRACCAYEGQQSAHGGAISELP